MQEIKDTLALIDAENRLPVSESKSMGFNSPEAREMLYAKDAPLETAAVLRMQRAGWKGPQIQKELGYPDNGPQLMRAMQHAIDQETYAHGELRPIHDALIAKGTK